MKLLFSILLIFNACTITGVRNNAENQFVVIKNSHIPGAGMGLFAKKDIPKDTLITNYEGRKIDLKEYESIIEKNEHWYVFAVDVCAGENVAAYIDGNRDHYASKVNFAPSEINGKSVKLQNAEFVAYCEEPYIRLHALRDIKAGEELYVTYGNVYDYHFMQFPAVQEFFLKITGVKLKAGEKFTFKF